MKRFLFAVMLLVGVSVSGIASDTVYDDTLVNGSVGVDSTYVLDNAGKGIDYLSFQAVYSTESYMAITFNDGIKSTGSITITTNASITGSTITINGNQYAEGVDWTAAALSSNSASSLYTAIIDTGAYSLGSLVVNSTGYISAGVYSLTGSSFTINGTAFIGQNSWFIQNTTSGTAQSILSILQSSFDGVILFSRTNSTINAKSTTFGKGGNYRFQSFTSSITVTSMTGGKNAAVTGINFSSASIVANSVIYATATVVGNAYDYTIYSTTPTALTVTGISGGVSGNINYALDRIISTNTYPTGLAVLLTNNAGTLPTGLTANTTYFIVNPNGLYFQLATTKLNASSGAVINLVDSTKDRGNFTVTAATVSAGFPFSFKWQVSNDNLNYYDLSVTSVTVLNTTGWSNYVWDFAKMNYEYIRCNLLSGKWGSIYLKLKGLGRKVAP